MKFTVDDFRLQISDLRLQSSHLSSQTSDFRFDISNFRFEISDVRCGISDVRSQTSDLRSENSQFKLPITGRHTSRFAGTLICNLRFLICNLQFLAVFLCLTTTALAQEPPRPVTDLQAVDHPNDVGNALDISWELSLDDNPGVDDPLVSEYRVLRKQVGEAEYAPIAELPVQTGSFTDRKVELGQQYLYQVVVVGPGGASAVVEAREAVAPSRDWFRKDRGWLALIILFVCGAVVAFIVAAKAGRDLYIRKIPGLEAVDEAVGRATEMGRSCLFVPGIQDINDIQTVAGITVLSRVASLTAEFGARLEVPTSRSLVMTTARETVAAAYLAEGRPDAYREDDIYYLTDEQFGYVAAVTGQMTREKPAACFYMGSFFAESLILAETGNAVGAIQVAGTAQPSQLPFFVAACDYTLIGEEFFAASAYLSGEPIQLGSLRGQDVGKLLVAALLLIGCGAATWVSVNGDGFAIAVVDYLTNHVLGSEGLLQ